MDTGAAVSLFPADVWQPAQFRPLGTTLVGGISARAECRIPATLAMVECVLSDGAALVGPVSIPAYLADSDEVPVLIGMSGLIERGILPVDVTANPASLELTP